MEYSHIENSNNAKTNNFVTWKLGYIVAAVLSPAHCPALKNTHPHHIGEQGSPAVTLTGVLSPTTSTQLCLF